MKWVLIIMIFGFDSGAHTNYVQFESKELCEIAASKLPVGKANITVTSICAQVKP